MPPTTNIEAPPPVGARVKDRRTAGTVVMTVTDVFPGSNSHPRMTLEWVGYDHSTGKTGPRYQTFSTENWRNRWEVIR